jgi:hypothetical protein
MQGKPLSVTQYSQIYPLCVVPPPFDWRCADWFVCVEIPHTFHNPPVDKLGDLHYENFAVVIFLVYVMHRTACFNIKLYAGLYEDIIKYI